MNRIEILYELKEYKIIQTKMKPTKKRIEHIFEDIRTDDRNTYGLDVSVHFSNDIRTNNIATLCLKTSTLVSHLTDK